MLRPALFLAFGMLASFAISNQLATKSAVVNCAGVSIDAADNPAVQHELSRARCVAMKR